MHKPRLHRTSFSFWTIIGLFLLTTMAGVIWRFTPLHEHLDLQTLVTQGKLLQTHAWAPFAVMGIFMAGGLVLFFHAVLLWSMVFIFDPWHAFLYMELGTMASALTVYGLGRVVRPDVVERIAGSYLDKVSRALAKKGQLTLMVLHWFPICPFSILNFIAGATHINIKDFIIGTFVGCTPGLLILVFFGHQIVDMIREQHWGNVGTILAGLVILFFVGRDIRRRLRKLKEA